MEDQDDTASATGQDPVVSRRLRQWALLGSVLGGGLGLWAILGWATGRPVLISLRPEYFPTSPKHAVGALLLGFALFVQVRVPAFRHRRSCATVAVLLLLALSGWSLLEVFTPWHLGIEPRLFAPPPGLDPGLVFRMSRVSSVCFLLAGLAALGLIRRPAGRFASLPPLLGLAVAAVNCVILLGYAYGTPLLYEGPIRPVAVLSAVSLACLGLTLVAAAGPDRFPLRTLLGPSVSSRMLRAFLPATFLTVLLGEFLSDVIRRHWFTNPSLVDALQSVAAAVVITFVVLRLARGIGGRLDVAEDARRQAEMELRVAHQELEQRVAERTVELDRRNDDLRGQIAERQLAEGALRQSEERFRQVVEHIREVFWMSDPDKNRILYVSPAYEEIWGRPCARLYESPRDWLEAVHPEDRDRVLQAALTRQTQGTYDELFRIVRPDGALRWIQDRAFPIRDESGKVRRIVGIAEDVTVRQRAATIRAALAGLSHQLSMVATPQEAARGILEVARELLGWDACYLHLCEPKDRIVPILAVDTLDGRQQELSEPPFPLAESPMMRRVIESGAQMVNDEPGREPRPGLVPFGNVSRRSAARMFVPVARDGGVIGVLSIQSYTPHAYQPEDLRTLQTLADQCGGALARIRAAESLRVSEARHRALIMAVPDFIFRVRRDGTVLDFKEPKESSLFARPEGMEGPTLAEIFPAPLAGRFQEHLERASQTGEMQTFEFQFSASEAARDFEARFVPGALEEVTALIRDVTERSRLEKEVLEISANERRGIGHNLHDGLGQFLGGLAIKAKILEENLAQHSSPQAPAAGELVRLANNAVEQTRTLARGLDPIEVELQGLVPALEKLADDVRQLFDVSCRFESRAPGVALSPFASLQLYRITQEAITNAVKHGRAGHIDVVLTRDAAGLCLRIVDDGSGLAAPSGRPAGLGVRIMHYRARCIGAVLRLHSPPGKGVEVQCQLSDAIRPPGRGTAGAEDQAAE